MSREASEHQVAEQAAAGGLGEHSCEWRVGVEAVVLCVKNRGKRHVKAVGVVVERGFEEHEIAAL